MIRRKPNLKEPPELKEKDKDIVEEVEDEKPQKPEEDPLLDDFKGEDDEEEEDVTTADPETEEIDEIDME